ncbi:transcription factor 20-like [Brienomyrus brachyistius]|uniref:transcription factor 20-like n=1 Tax=Brienomyrus brachyistius TaxID=42636 RepID=UPI0020B3A56E|nr:transcription factor 20-like [Brienomyrus brachyistius]XP_048870534.1 transcription factor 20-like [Brienomyrus brachyistius]
MQSFRESTVPPTPHLGFTSAIDGGRGTSSYLAQPLGPQNSPRMPEEYVGVQQQQHNPHSMMSLQTSHAALMQGYASRGRGGGGGEALPCDAKHGGGNSTNSPYRKDMVDYYYSSTNKEGHRRGGQGLGYGTGLGFSNMDGQVPHQYRPVRTSGSASGMSRYQMDYRAVAGSGGSSNNSNGSSGVGAFSPSHQYSLGQNPAVQTAAGSQIHLRHQAPNYPSHQTLHHGQLQRAYALPGHRFPPPFSYPTNAPTGPVGVYNSLPQRYQSGRSGGSFESKSNSSSSATSSHNLGLANQNNAGQFDSVGQSYPVSDYSYNSQSSHSHPAHPVHPHRHPQQSLGPGYDTPKTHPPNLLNQPGLPYPKHPSSSKSSSSSMNLSVPQFPSHDLSKSPMHSQTQQPQIHQNFSPISNPSPVASVVQSPSCSSSPSPLMGILEGAGSSVVPPTHPQSHPPIQKSRNSHNRLLQMMPQLSPTPSSNSNSSSCGSSGNVSTAGLNANTGSSHSQTRVGVGTKGGVSDERSSSSFYSSSSHDKLTLDPGTNSLNALSSQVANLPDTVQHVMLSDSVLSDKRNKDTGHQVQKPMHATPADQQRNSDVSAPCGAPIRTEPSKRPNSGGASSECGIDEDSQPLENPRDDGGDGEELSETPTEKMATLSETKSTGSCPPLQNPMNRAEVKSQNEGGSQVSPLPDSSAPSSSSFSSHLSPSVEHSAFLSPTHPPSASLSASSTPSPTITSSAKSGACCVRPKVMDCEQLSNKNEQGVNKGSTMAERKQNSDICQGREKYGKEKGKTKQNEEESHTEECTKEKEGEIEKLKDFEHSNEPGIKQNSETHTAGGVGVIVSTRSEITQQEEQSNAVMSEPIYKPDCPNNPGGYSSYAKQQTPSQFSFIDSSNHNGESRCNLSTNPSPHGAKVSPKSSVEHWLASHAHSDTQKALLSYSKSPQNSGMKNSGRPVLSEVAMGPNFQFQEYCQPQRQYSPEVRKTLDIDGHGRKDLGSVTERGRDGNAQLQHPFPSLLQEVLQGYHTDKNYARSERIAQQFQAPVSHNYSHYRHSQTTMEHTRPHVMTSPARMAMNHHIQTQTSAYEKLYPLKERHESEVCIGQDPLVSSWGSVGAGTKRAQWNTLDKCKVEPPSHSTSTMPLSADLSILPHSRHINLADYSLPSRKLSSNHSSPSSAVQQLLLQETDQIGHSGITAAQPQNTSLSERRSVICDIAPSCLATPDRELDGVKGERSNCESQSECKGTSVIQQSVTFSATVDKGSTSNEQGVKREMEPEEKQQDIKKAHHLETSVKNDFPANENVSEHDNAPHQPQDKKPSKDGRVNLEKLTPYQPHHPRHSHANTHSSVASSRFHAYFEGSEETSPSAVTGGFGFKDGRKETNKTLQHPHHLSPHHNFSSLSLAQNPQSTDKLQTYLQSNSSSLRSSHSSDGWTAPNNIQPSYKDIKFPGSGQQQNQLAATQQQSPKISPHGSFCEKMWDQTSEKEKEGKREEENIQRRQQPPLSVLPLAPPTETKQFESNPSRVESQNILKSLHGVSDKGDSSGKSINIMTHGKTRTGSSGDTNPLMMRRRVRSFISPIPAKRQHQDVCQQRGTPSQHSNIVLSSATRHVTSGLSSSNATHYNLTNQKTHPTTPPRSDSPKSPCSLAKTKILPPRKSRGLKLEAIVQKITPTLKKTANTNSNVNMDSVSNHLSLTDVASYGPDTPDHDSTDGGVFIRAGAESENCLPYLSEGLSLDDIISYRGVEQTGPPPPTAYPCDPHQDPRILKCDMMGNIAMGVVRDLEPELDFGVGASGHPKVDNDCAGEKDKDDLQVPPDFPLLGPLPPAPPLPCPVQGSPPPLSSGLSDIQNFTATYQQLETRRGEHTAAMLLRQKLQEGEMGMGTDTYAGRDFLGTKSSHHNESLGHCLLANPPHIQMPHHHQLSSPRNIMTGSQFIEPKLENAVPKGYFPSGKKRGRPVGSVNKQKRIQSQPQSLPVAILPSSQTSTSVPAATAPAEAQNCNTINVIPADSPQTEKVPTTPVSPSNTSQMGNEVVEAEETKVEFSVKPCKQRQAKREESHGGLSQKQRRQEVDSIPDKEDINAGIGEISSAGIFHAYSKSAFAPYIHVESKLEMGNVCTIVNWEDEKKKLDSTADDGGGRCTAKEGVYGAAPPSSTLSLLVKRDGEKSKVKEKKMLENVETVLIQSSPTGKALPSSGHVLPGPAMSESSTRGHLLCCLCKKWANYKDLGDLYGPYYPPDYLTKLSKNPPVTRQSQGTVRLSSPEVNLGSITAESAKQESSEVAIKTHTSQISSNSAADQATDLDLATTVTDTTSVRDELDAQCDMGDIGNNDNLPNIQDLVSEKNTTAVELKPLEERNNLDQQLTSQQSQTEDAQKRPQHRKLTSHPRFKRRHKSNEDLRKTAPTNNKALLPFQPPPPLQLLKQGDSDLSAALAMLPQVPLDPEELWVHEGCIVWASGVFLVNGRLYGLQEALDGARDMCCSYCEMVGSTLGCYSKGCTLRYHYLCAIEADCSLNEDNFSLRCPKHKFPQNSKPAKVVDPDQSGRG